MASASRRLQLDSSPKRPGSSSSSPARAHPIVELAQRRVQRFSSPAPPAIPGRRVYHLDLEANRGERPSSSGSLNAPGAAASSPASPSSPVPNTRARLDSSESRSRTSSPLPHTSTTAAQLQQQKQGNGSVSGDDEDEEVIAEGPAPTALTPRPRKMRSREAKRKPVTLTNLQMASLSTPELHLASDPMLDTEEPSFLRRLGRPTLGKAPVSQDNVNTVDSNPTSGNLHTRTRSSELVANQVPSVAYSSFSAAMNAVETDARPSIPSSYSRGQVSGARPKTSTGFDVADARPRSHDSGGPGSRPASPSVWQNGNPSTETLSPSAERPPSSPSSSASPALGNANTWFQRQRRWSVNTRSPELRPSTANADGEDGLAHLSSALSASSIATLGTDAGFFSEGDELSSSGAGAHTDTSLGVDQVHTLGLSLESLRSARTYLVRELSRLTPSEMGDDSVRIANLAWFTREADAEARGVNMDSTREMFEFWKSISDGVLLCLLANRVRPGSIDRIDRRDVEWVKADNISRFLRAARDHLGLRSKDLFQTLDLTDATVEGLLRASHTILVIERLSRRSTQLAPSRSYRPPSSDAYSSPSDRLSPPATPKSRLESLSSSPDQEASAERTRATIQQNRREAERILVSMARPEPLAAEASVKSRRRRSGEVGSSVLPACKMRGSSITFADNVKASSTSGDEESRMPYRDRRLSESAISLTGVAEEEAEDDAGAPQPNALPAVSQARPPSRAGEVRRGSSESEKSQKGAKSSTATSTAGFSSSPLARTSSQRRISAELGLGLGQLPRSVIGSTENLDDYMYPAAQSSPSRIPPTRRHSARLQAVPSLLNPSRESLLTLGGSDGDSSLAAPQHVPRVPFPKSALQSSSTSSSASADSPGAARRIGRHLSLNAGSSGVDSLSSVASSASVSFGQPLPARYGPRPAYRHMRYSSDLHVPSMPARPVSVGRSPDLSSEERSFAAGSSSRARFDSEVGSIYTNTFGSPTADEGGGASAASSSASAVPRMSREPSVAPSSKHKLVVVEEGKPNITYQLGNCIGRGQFGSVYRALNLNSGQMVAVKRIKLEGRSDDDVTQLMNEVDLLKSLVHPSVVKYEGLVRGPEVVSIILEYVENGSLLHTLKAFGNFPEKLVASYVVKILEGLNYLHEQNVVHCDLKAANILTTKNGNVKLSDFGVSLNLKAVEQMNNKSNDAIGTPNWMAPEVIELKGVTTAADIWSLGCTIIELLTGKPPYYDMLAMSAMFRIVEDDCPPIPEKCSPPLRDLLLQCFHKDPVQRPSAETLFEHQWVRQTWSGHKELRPQDSVPFLRRISADLRKLDPAMFHRQAAAAASANDTAGQQVPGSMERSSSSPPPTLARPGLDGKRSLTTPAAVDADAQQQQHLPAHGQVPTSSPPTNAVALAALSMLPHHSGGSVDTASAAAVSMIGRSPDVDPASPTGLSPLQDPSLLDLSVLGNEHAKPHAFVKSTFSKAVRCKICSEPVKKHAVLCEECGLVCHARCAGQAPSPCNLRAQLLMFQARTSMDRPRVVSPAPSLVAAPNAAAAGANGNHLPVQQPASPTSPALSATASFRFPFGIKRSSKQSTAEPPAPALRISTEQQGFDNNVSPLGTPLGPVGGVAMMPTPAATKGSREATNQQGSAPRRRRISLIPGRQPSPSPDVAMAAANSASTNSSQSGLNGHRRPSSVSYGSVSGSSSISSHAGGSAVMLKTTSDSSSSNQQHQQAPSSSQPPSSYQQPLGLQQQGTSTPQLLPHGSRDGSQPEPTRFRRRLSSGFGFGHSEVSLHGGRSASASMRKGGDMGGAANDRINPATGQVTPTAALAERRKSKRNASKSDCTIM
ncbi:uncharacterized protein PFL1_02667 [Pseudozyma flocculosa PF-1]|nr:uncharacterized protein PFL1_02667 [Pseudozyma flocculosa PF-1]EPQ29994.1 hypothetical protein PFL1_02667 [Pseudozyma flocculosa PF-1]